MSGAGFPIALQVRLALLNSLTLTEVGCVTISGAMPTGVIGGAINYTESQAVSVGVV